MVSSVLLSPFARDLLCNRYDSQSMQVNARRCQNAKKWCNSGIAKPLLKGLIYNTCGHFFPRTAQLTKWALTQWPMRPKAEWAIDSEAMRARGIIVLVKSN